MSSNATPRDHTSYTDLSSRVADRKVWEDWPGYHHFFCNGRFMLPKQWKGSLGTAILIMGLEGLFIGLVALKLDAPLSYIAILSGAILAIFAVFFLMSTCLTDPGVLPRLQPSDAYLRMQLPRTREVAMGDRSVVIRYDDVYHYYRPPRAHHCRVLNVVVMKFDHFCPWTGNTIGLRNYRAFVSFLAFTFLALAHATAFCALHIVRHLRDDDAPAGGGGPPGEVSAGGDAAAAAGGAGAIPAEGGGVDDESTMEKLLEIVATPVLLIVFAAFILAVGGLLGFHASLISRGLTTYESIESVGSLYSEGCCANCRAVWCTPMPPPFVDFSQSLRAAHARQPPAPIRMFNPHLSRECGTPGGSSHRSSRTPRREHRREYRELRELGGRGSGRRAGERLNGSGRLPGRPEAGGILLEYAPRAGAGRETNGWDKYSPRASNGRMRNGDESV
eukprot:jgi/Ulvmu1/391/UM001_0398.1